MAAPGLAAWMVSDRSRTASARNCSTGCRVSASGASFWSRRCWMCAPDGPGRRLAAGGRPHGALRQRAAVHALSVDHPSSGQSAGPQRRDHGTVRARGPGAGGHRGPAGRPDPGSIQALRSASGADAGIALQGTRAAPGLAARRREPLALPPRRRFWRPSRPGSRRERRSG